MCVRTCGRACVRGWTCEVCMRCMSYVTYLVCACANYIVCMYVCMYAYLVILIIILILVIELYFQLAVRGALPHSNSK